VPKGLGPESPPYRSTPAGAFLTWPNASSSKLSYLVAATLGAYGLLHVLIRLVISEGAELDEAEQLLLSQSFAIGYTDQPPLYTWLLIGFEAILGVDILSLAILKNLLLFITHFCLFLTARIVLNNAVQAFLTTLSLWLIPQIAWESHRDLTHSVLVTSISSGFFYVTVTLLHTGRTRHYLMLGLLLGLGALSKHSFLLFAAALFVAILSQHEVRGRMLDRRMLLVGALGALIVLPHFLWLLEHFHPTTSPTTRKLGLQGGIQSVMAIGKGLGKLIWASIRFLTPFWLICLLAFPQLVTRRFAGAPWSPRDRRTLERFFLMVFIILAAAVIFFGVTHFKDRWMQPFLFLAPLYVFACLQQVGGIAPGRFKMFACVLAFFGFIFLVAPLAQAWVAPSFGMHSRLHAPFMEVARQLRQAGFRQGTIVAETTFIGGNLRLVFPTSRVVTPEVLSGMSVNRQDTGQCLVVWDSDDRQPLPSSLSSFLEETLHARLPNDQVPAYIDARLKRSLQRVLSIGFLLFPAGAGECR
jgi:hypothetical protein